MGLDVGKDVLGGVEERVEDDGFEIGIEDSLSFFDLLFEEHGPFDFFGEGLFEGVEFGFDKGMAIGAPYEHIFKGFSLLFFY